MNVFVTGADGQLGRSLQKVVTKHTIIPFSHGQLDITDLEAVRRAIHKVKPDLVINAAAYNDVDRAEAEPEKAFSVNEKGPRNLSVMTEETGVPFMHISTDYVFDGKKRVPYLETDQVNPLSTYAKSKWAGEQEVRKTNPRHFIVRTAWLFGPEGDNFFRKILALSKKGPVRIVNDQFSSPTYAPHLAEKLLILAHTKEFGTYHMAGRGIASRYEQFQSFIKLMGLSVPMVPISSADFKQAAERPMFSPMATIHDVRFHLPPWEEEVAAFVKDIKKEETNGTGV